MFCKECGGAVISGTCKKCGSSVKLMYRSRDLEDILLPPGKKCHVVWMIGDSIWEEQILPPGREVIPKRPSPNLVGKTGRFIGWDQDVSVMPSEDLIIHARAEKMNPAPFSALSRIPKRLLPLLLAGAALIIVAFIGILLLFSRNTAAPVNPEPTEIEVIAEEITKDESPEEATELSVEEIVDLSPAPVVSEEETTIPSESEGTYIPEDNDR